MDPRWLDWAMRLQALSQSGLTFAGNPYEIERYEAIRHIAAEMLAAGSDAGVTAVVDLFATQKGYATPKVDVRGVVFRDGAMLFVQECADGNRWTLPGGWADVGDTPSHAVEREVFEETGFEVRAVKVLAIFDRRRHGHVPLNPFHIYKIFFHCELLGGAATASAETRGATFFRRDAVPSALSLGRVTPTQIARMFEHLSRPELPTDFD